MLKRLTTPSDFGCTTSGAPFTRYAVSVAVVSAVMRAITTRMLRVGDMQMEPEDRLACSA